MSSIRHLVDFERWPIAEADCGWKNTVTFPIRTRRSPATESRRRALEETVAVEIIPRLLVAHRSRANNALKPLASLLRQDAKPTTTDVTEMVRLVIEEPVGRAFAHVLRLRARGVSLEAIFLHLLAPAANLLGDMWVDDTADFATVTIATSRLQQILRELAPEFQLQNAARPHGTPALLVAAPGDQHTFGVSMLQELFRRQGWLAPSHIPQSAQELADIARTAPFKVIGLSVSCDAPTEAITKLIKDLRRTAVGTCKILVGGRFFNEHPELARVVTADGTAADAQTVIYKLSSVLDTKAV